MFPLTGLGWRSTSSSCVLLPVCFLSSNVGPPSTEPVEWFSQGLKTKCFQFHVNYPFAPSHFFPQNSWFAWFYNFVILILGFKVVQDVHWANQKNRCSKMLTTIPKPCFRHGVQKVFIYRKKKFFLDNARILEWCEFEREVVFVSSDRRVCARATETLGNHLMISGVCKGWLWPNQRRLSELVRYFLKYLALRERPEAVACGKLHETLWWILTMQCWVMQVVLGLDFFRELNKDIEKGLPT